MTFKTIPRVVDCPMFEDPITPGTCRQHSAVASKNQRFCAARMCTSPYRLCGACILQGYTAPDASVTDPVAGVCAFHDAFGIEADRKNGRPLRTRPSAAPRSSTAVPTVREGEVLGIDPERIRPYAGQPRKYFDPESLEGLQKSIALVGQIQPGIVRPMGDDPDHDFELVDGERRWLCCRRLKRPFRAVPTSVEDDAVQFERSIAVNFQRADHTPMEESRAVVRILAAGRSETEVAAIFGRSAAWVNVMKRLVDLHPDLQEELGAKFQQESARGKSRRSLPISVATLLARLPAGQQLEEYRNIREDELNATQAVERLEVRLRTRGVAVGHHEPPVKRRSTLTPSRIVERMHGRFGSLRNNVQTWIEHLEPLAAVENIRENLGDHRVESVVRSIDKLVGSLTLLKASLVRGGPAARRQG